MIKMNKNDAFVQKIDSHFICWLFFLKFFYTSHVLFWGHWYPCFVFLVMFPLRFKARLGSALFPNVIYIPWDSHFSVLLNNGINYAKKK